MRRHLWFTAVVLIVLLVPAAAGDDDASRLTLEKLFAPGSFQAKRFGPARWLPGGDSYLLLEDSPAHQDKQDIVLYHAESGAREVLAGAGQLIPPGETEPLGIEDYTVSPDHRQVLIFTRTQRVWRQNDRGEYWVLSLPGGSLKRLGGPGEAALLKFAKLAPGGTLAAYQRGNDLYAEDLESGTVTRLTGDGSATVINGSFDWAYEEEFGIRDGFQWSPDGKSIAYWQIDTAGVPEFTMIDNTGELYPRLTRFPYPKVGQTLPSARIGIVPAAGGATVWMELSGDPRQHYLPRMEWSPDSRALLLQRLNRAQNTVWMVRGDAASGKTGALITETDAAWLDVVDSFSWLPKTGRYLWESERDGWRRFYTTGPAGDDFRPVTTGDFDAIGLVSADDEGGWLYFLASPDQPARRFLYRSKLDGSAPPERLTPAGQPGTHRYQIAPGARWAFHTWSATGKAPVTELVRLPGHQTVRILEANAELQAKVDLLRKQPTEFFRVDIGGGVQLDGWIMKPPEMEPARRYPVLIHVYGEPAGTTVNDSWGGRNWLWHLFLTQRGYIVASFDNRGTPAPRGRAWRKSIYRKIGIISSEDQAAAVRTIGQWPFVDPARIGVWGWSGGGSMTLNALFRYPELYKMGMAVAAVSDQRLYDAIYQERYMGLLPDTEADYIEGSPVTHAHRLEGDLLLVHGTGDDNVHYQSAEKLIDALVKEGKPFTMMAYPNRTHAVSEGPGTSRHLYELLTRFLIIHLPAGPSAPAE